MTSSDETPPPFAPPSPAPQQGPYAPPQTPSQPSPYIASQPGPYAPPSGTPTLPVPPHLYAPVPPTPPPTHSGSGRGLAIVALVAALLAFLLALGTLAVVFVGSGGFADSYTLTGTAPQVVDGEPYSGAKLADELRRVIDDDGGTASSIECPDTPRVDSDAVTTCTGTVDDYRERLTVDFQDGEGHFTLEEQDAG